MKSESRMSPIAQSSKRSKEHVCHCGVESPLVTSRSEANPGRRFFGCGNYGTRIACDYFTWYDPPRQAQATGTTDIILGLLKKVDRIEREKDRAIEREREKEREMQREREMMRERARAMKETWNTVFFIFVVVAVVGLLFMAID